MKTVYLLKNSPKSFRVLLKLVKIGDITTNIIIVDKFYSKILKRDKRVKEFPLIINTLPLANGLIPKISKVLPFRLYIHNMQNIRSKRDYNYNNGRIITYKPSLKYNDSECKYNSKCKYNFTSKKPVIKAVKQKDKSVNIILYNK